MDFPPQLVPAVREPPFFARPFVTGVIRIDTAITQRKEEKLAVSLEK
jgi:hypothetical protein